MDKEWLEQVEYGHFSLPKFCDDAAALAKYLIQAREKLEPGFLGNGSVYESWKLGNIDQDKHTVTHLLSMGRVLVDVLYKHMVSMGGSGGVRLDDPLADFKSRVISLTSTHAIDVALQSCAAGEEVDWEQLAKWEELPKLRSELNQTYLRIGDNANESPLPSLPPVAESSRVKLFRFGSVPVALIDHHRVSSLTEAQYDVIKALLEAGEGGLSKDALDNASNRTEARKTLKRLSDKHAIWKNVISFPGSPGKGYRIH